MNLNQGEFVTSEPFQCGDSRFCVKLYPKGGGDRKKLFQKENKRQGFGQAYAIQPLFGTADEKVSLYLQFLNDDEEDSVDATFALRLKGNQQNGPKFDVEWRAGMRFVELSKSNLAQGLANDFGASLMQTPLLKQFMGISDDNLDNPRKLQAEIEVTLHEAPEATKGSSSPLSSDSIAASSSKPFFGSLAKDIRTPAAGSTFEHDPERVRVGKIVVPILNKLSQRPRMFEIGAYPGVEYRILRILNPEGNEVFTSCPGATYEMRPIYPLVQQLERPWPVAVKEQEIPKLYTQNMYNAVSAVGSLATAVFGLFSAFLISQAVSLFFIPSRSMDPTLQIGDVLLVDKVTPRVFPNSKHSGDVVLFSPPEKLREIVANNGGKLTSRDLFVKRIAAEPGDTVSVTKQGTVTVNDKPVKGNRELCEAEPLRLIEKYVKESDAPVELSKNEVFVMGDCSSVSIDSRVWGPLPSNSVVGRPILRIWPVERFGPVPSLPVTSTMQNDWSD